MHEPLGAPLDLGVGRRPLDQAHGVQHLRGREAMKLGAALLLLAVLCAVGELIASHLWRMA